MTVGAISNVYQYSTTYQAQFFGSSLSNERINSLMKEYGVIQTGDEYNDLQALFNAMYNYYSTIAAGQSQPQGAFQANNNIPWASLMAQVGLSASGELAQDYQAFNNKITFLKNNSGIDYSEENRLNSLEQSASYVFVAPAQQEQQTRQPSGADITAMLNKAFLFGQ